MKFATQVKTQTELAALLDVGKAAISDAKRRNIVPAEWLLKLSRPPYFLNPAWLESGAGAMRIPHEGISEGNATYVIKSDCKFQIVPLARSRATESGLLLEEDESCEDRYAFATKWLEQKGGPAYMRMMRVSGDSMRPTLLDNDLVLVDESQKAIREGKIYAIRIDADVVIKRVAIKPGAVALISDNRNLYDPMDVDVEHDSKIQIIGRVIWIARDLL